MRVAVIGNGPSAKGHGPEIDACDVVVRIKAFWVFGAEDAGDKIDVWAWYGLTDPRVPDFVPEKDIAKHIPPHVQHWFTDCMNHVKGLGYHDRLVNAERISRTLASHKIPMRQMSNEMRGQAQRHVRAHATTGFLTICMAIERFSVDELLLYGFDSTTLEREDYYDARPPEDKWVDSHDTLAEKLAIAKIRNGTWLGRPINTKLTWPDMPEM